MQQKTYGFVCRDDLAYASGAESEVRRDPTRTVACIGTDRRLESCPAGIRQPAVHELCAGSMASSIGVQSVCRLKAESCLSEGWATVPCALLTFHELVG